MVARNREPCKRPRGGISYAGLNGRPQWDEDAMCLARQAGPGPRM